MGKPAARITDLHMCSMTPVPPGLPIIPPCSINTIIGGMPAARVTDLCACGGPPPTNVDPIITGAANVLINGLPAARLSDQTAKGGKITTGFPTVLIGMNGGGPQVQIAMLSPACAKLHLELIELGDAADMARLASVTYDDPANNENLPENTRRATPEELESLGLMDRQSGYDATKISDSNFRADVFINEDPVTGEKNYVVGFKGTTASSGEDWKENLKQGGGYDSAYYNQAIEIGNIFNSSAPGQVRYTGHSLGGGMASSASVVSGANATTFNAAGLHPSTVERVKNDDVNVNAWHNERDPLSSFQDANDWFAPSAIGERKSLPPTTTWTPEESAMIEANVDPDNWTPDWVERKVGEAKAKATQQLRFHSMDEMEQIIQNDIARVKNEKSLNGCP